MRNGVASALIFPNPPEKGAPGFMACGRSSRPSSTCSRAVVLGDGWRRTSLQQENRLRLVQEVALRVGSWERWNAELREPLRARLGRDPKPSAGIVNSQSLRTTGVGGTERGFDPAKGVEGRKRHLLVDAEGLVLQARVHSARVPDADGIRLLLEPVRARFARLSHLWVDAGYQGRGKRWAEEALGLNVEVVRKPKKPLPEKVAELWAAEWAKEGVAVDWQKLMPPKGFRVL